MPNQDPYIAQELLSHQTFLSRLAIDLVGKDADDLVQDVWQRALERPPLDGRQLRGWLARVARNLAANRWRDEARRTEREEHRASEQPAADELMARFELRKELVGALDSLNQSYRETILLRYFEGLAPRDIARRQGTPVATVKKRLRRGLEQLREALDKRTGGDRATWMSAVTALVAPVDSGVVTGSLVIGGMTMGTMIKVSAVVLVAAVCMYFVTRTPRSESVRMAAVERKAADMELGGATVLSVAEDPATEVGQRSSVEAVPPGDVSAARETHVLRGRVVSEVLGSPLPGATVTITRRMHSEFWIPDTEERDARRPVVTAVTDDEGRFEVSVPTAVPLDVEAYASKHATARRDHLFAGDDVELRLTAAAILEGTLTRSDGAPVADALVLGRDSRRVEQCRARTDISGRFLIEDLQAGLLTVEITPLDAAPPPSKRIELRGGQRTRLDLVLEAGVRIHGVVSDPQGHPIAGAEVGLGSSFQRSVFTDVHGSYEMFGLGGAKRRDLGGLRARAEGYGGEGKKLEEADLAQDTRVDIVLHPGRIATGRVVDTDGHPIEGVYVAGLGSKKVEGVSRSDWESAVTEPDGCFELNSLQVLIDHQLFLRKDRYGTRVYDFPADEGDRERIDYGDLVLHAGGRIEGILRAQTGTPIPDHLVKLRGANQDLGRFRPDTEALKKTWVTAVRHSRTDTQGRFHFSDLPGGELQVTARVKGKPASKAEVTVKLPEGGQVEDVELTLDLGDPITGVVRTNDGSPAIGVLVQVAGGKEQTRIRATSGEGGRFELFGVTEDMGEVELFTNVASYNWYNPDAHLGASHRATAHAGDRDVVLELRELDSLTGRVEDAEGQPLAGVQVLAYQSGTAHVAPAVLTKVTSDEKGAFRLDLPEECLVDLVTAPPKVDDASEVDNATEAPELAAPEPAILEFVASDAQGVVLRFAK